MEWGVRYGVGSEVWSGDVVGSGEWGVRYGVGSEVWSGE